MGSTPIRSIMDEKDAKIAELEALLAKLQQQLKVAKATIESYRQQDSRRWKDSRDHLDYEDDRR